MMKLLLLSGQRTLLAMIGTGNIRPIFPIGVLIFAFIIALGVTVFFAVRSRVSLSEKIFKIVRMGIIYVLVLIIGLRPVTVETEYEFSTKNLDVLFVVDGTISMWAEDYSGNNTRMAGVKADIKYIVNELAGSNFGLVTFDDTAHVLSPYTQDMSYIIDTVDTMLMPDSYSALGSSLSVPYKDMEALLLSSSRKENRKTIVFFLSDGEITNNIELISYEDLARYVDSGAVLGYGSAFGGRMRENYSYIYDYQNSTTAISRIDEDNLKQIAEDLGISYLNVNGGNTGIQGLIEIIREQSATIVEHGDGAERYVDIYYYFAAALFVMLLMETALFIKRGRL